MAKRTTDELFQLVKSLSKGDKRNFKLFVKRQTGTDDLKVVQLFDALDKMDEYDEELLLQKNPSIKKQQLSNIKGYLYKQLLAGLRQVKDDDNIDLQLHELMDYARILYNRGLYLQSLKTLEKIKEHAKGSHQLVFQLEAVLFEKKIESLHITRSMEDRAEKLASEAKELTDHVSLLVKVSNLSLQLYSWYIKMGHARDEKDVSAIKLFFETNLPKHSISKMGFYEKMYLYQSYCWYTFIMQDLLSFYRYAQKWVDIFDAEPQMKISEAGQYIKGLHNLLTAHFVLNNYDRYNETLEQFEAFASSHNSALNTNILIQTFVYLYTAKIDRHFLEGTFSQGLELVRVIEEKIKEYELNLDRHRILVFYYKIACLYFGSGDNEKAIDYLNKIINWKVDLRTDLQCYARLLHLIAHYELGNYSILEYLIKSVYRFMANMKNLSVVEEEIFKFLRKSFSLQAKQIIPAFRLLKEKLEKYHDNPLETRSFMYLDIISWLESKIQNVPVQQIRRQMFLGGRKVRA
ncbi:hypothetical protein QTN47_09340 [Danxiaibacter flavus]|uniref:Tetratricopeptide repeat protein n=1 Tax=Danxiaibacter flavus TaxID=3049108 RepID=A0ABV3ZDM7_9BACT|nr:hypothetical protein QNM32_09340 [Chitinophagaceae bacterium DXS]